MGVKIEENILKIKKTLEIISEKPVNLTKLSQQLLLSYPATLNLVEALEKTGLVQRQIDPGPPRQIIVAPTPLGKCIAQCLLRHTQATPAPQQSSEAS